MMPAEVKDFNDTLRLSFAIGRLAPVIYEALCEAGYRSPVLWHELTPEGRDTYRDIAMAVLWTQRGEHSTVPFARVEAERARERHRYFSGLNRDDKVVGMITPVEAAK